MMVMVPNVLEAMKHTRAKRMGSDMRMIASAVEAYAEDQKTYPRAANIDELVRVLLPMYVKDLPRVDPWGNPYVFEAARCERDRCASYYVASGGVNGIIDEKTLTAYGRGKRATVMTSDDIVYSDGNWLPGGGGYF